MASNIFLNDEERNSTTREWNRELHVSRVIAFQRTSNPPCFQDGACTGDTTPSPMRGSSATERVEANSSSRKPQAASADRRRRTNQGCPLRNYPTPKN
ncbi:hypothetical protein ANTPLA_LOCUS3676 [Anthophora plagiata]